jgi:aminocarboxymuconate-semialdehyde decarboxylase
MAAKKIDIHTHILPEKIPNWMDRFGYGDFIWLQENTSCCANMMRGDKFFRTIDENCWSAPKRIEEMNATNVDIQVLSTVPVLFNYWAKPKDGLETSRFFNDHIASVSHEYPERFIGLGTVPLQDVDLAIKEMERCVNVLKMPGIEIGTNINQVNLSDEKFDAFWQAAEALNCSILIHPWEMMGEENIEKYWLPWLVGMPAETARAIASLIFAGVFDKYPNLKFAFAHGGGSLPFTIGRLEHGHKVRPDLVAIDNKNNPRNYLGRFWIDSLVHDEMALEFLLKMIGPDKICCGSDYPFPLGELDPPGGLIEQFIKDEHLKNKLLHQNALEWLGMAK